MLEVEEGVKAECGNSGSEAERGRSVGGAAPPPRRSRLYSQTGMSLQQSVSPVCQSLSWVW